MSETTAGRGARRLLSRAALACSLAIALVACDGSSDAPDAPNSPDAPNAPNAPVAPEAPEAPQLFSGSAGDYGFPFEARIRELRRLPAVSIVRQESVGSDGVVGRSFFTGGCLGEICRQRGFTHLVILREGPAEDGGGDAGTKVWEYTVGFTNDANADLAAAFPAFHDPSRDARVVSATFVADALGGWPPGSKATPAPEGR